MTECGKHSVYLGHVLNLRFWFVSCIDFLSRHSKVLIPVLVKIEKNMVGRTIFEFQLSVLFSSPMSLEASDNLSSRRVTLYIHSFSFPLGSVALLPPAMVFTSYLKWCVSNWLLITHCSPCLRNECMDNWRKPFIAQHSFRLGIYSEYSASFGSRKLSCNNGSWVLLWGNHSAPSCFPFNHLLFFPWELVKCQPISNVLRRTKRCFCPHLSQSVKGKLPHVGLVQGQ